MRVYHPICLEEYDFPVECQSVQLAPDMFLPPVTKCTLFDRKRSVRLERGVQLRSSVRCTAAARDSCMRATKSWILVHFRRGHRRNASEYLPDSAHYRAGHSYQDRENRFQDAATRNYDLQQGSSAPPQPAGGPPRYTSNPNLTAPEVNPEYERPPPYYYPGAPPVGSSAGGSDVAPPLPMPNRS